MLLFSCSFDFERRLNAAKMLTSLVTLPGLKVEQVRLSQERRTGGAKRRLYTACHYK